MLFYSYFKTLVGKEVRNFGAQRPESTRQMLQG